MAIFSYMQRASLTFSFLFALPFLLFSQEESLRLQFIPNVSMKHISEINGQFDVQIGDESYLTTFDQVINGVLLIESDGTDPIIDAAPLDMTYVFTGFRAQVENDAGSYKVDTKFPEESIAAEALTKLINHPIHLHFGANFHLDKGSKELLVLQQKMGLFDHFDYGELLGELFQDFFVLADRNLTVGTKVYLDEEKNLELSITSITANEIQAEVKGNINPPIKEWMDDETPMKASLKTKVEGQIVWNRANALEYRALTITDQVAEVMFGEQQGVSKTHFVHKICTHR